jgi:hypothetical protein
MRIPRKSGEAVIVLGGRNGAFWFGFYAAMGVICAGSLALVANRWARLGVEWLAAWWGA